MAMFPLLRSVTKMFGIFSRYCSSLASVSDFETLPVLLPSREADTIAQFLITHHNPNHPMESCLQLFGITLTTSLFHQTLLRVRHNSKIALSLFVHALSLPFANLISITSYNLIIDIAAKVHQFDLAWKLLGDMENRGISPTHQTFSIIIRRLIAAGLTRQAVRAFDDMEAFFPDPIQVDSFIFLLDTLCKYRHVHIAVDLFNKRIDHYEPCEKTYNVLIYGWCKIGRIEMAEKFMKEMREKGIEPTVISYNILLNGICRRERVNADEKFEKIVKNAEKVFDEMRQRKIEPDVTSFSILLHLYSKALKPEMMLEKLKMMKAKGISPNVVTYTSVVKCLCGCGRLEEAEDMLDEMTRCGITPNAATYNFFLKECRSRKDVKGAMRLYRMLKEEKVVSLHTYHIVLRMMVDLNETGNVREIWNDLKVSGIGPDLDSYTVMIHGLCEQRKWKEACQFMVEMIENGITPHKITFKTLHTGLNHSDNSRTWRRMRQWLDEEALKFGADFCDYHVKPYRR